MKGQELTGDLGDARQFFAGEVKILFRLGLGIDFLPQEIKQVGDGVERVADLVGDGGGQSSCLSKAVAGLQDLLGLAALGHIAEDHHYAGELSRFVDDGSAVHFNGIFLARPADEQHGVRDADDPALLSHHLDWDR